MPDGSSGYGFGQDDADTHFNKLIADAGTTGFFTRLGPDHCAHFTEGTGTLLVCFEHLDALQRADRDGLGLGRQVQARTGSPQLTVLTTRTHGFRDAAVIDFFDRLVDDSFFEGFERIVFFGARATGHAAACFSVAALGAELVLIQPKSTSTPSPSADVDTIINHPISDLTNRYANAPQMARTAARALILLDPHVRANVVHASRFEGDQTDHLHLPHLGEDGEAALEAAGLIGPLLDLVVTGQPSTSEIARLLRPRRQTPAYMRGVLGAIDVSKRPARAGIVARFAQAKFADAGFEADVAVAEQALAQQQSAPVPEVTPEALDETSQDVDLPEPAALESAEPAEDEAELEVETDEGIEAPAVTDPVSKVEAAPEAQAEPEAPASAPQALEIPPEPQTAPVPIVEDASGANEPAFEQAEKAPEPEAPAPHVAAATQTHTETLPAVITAPKPRLRLLRLLALLSSLVTAPLYAGALATVLVVFGFAREIPHEDTLVNYSPALTTRVVAASGQPLDTFEQVRRDYVPLDDIPFIVQQAFISAEDKNFFDHKGIDPRAIAIAAYEAVSSFGADTRGASTITQQVMKNLILDDAPMLERKVLELALASRVEQRIGKQKVLEIYLNEIFLGQNAYGVAAASEAYFNKPLSSLVPHEAAVLAALAQSPSRLHPVRNFERLMARRNYVLREMYENGYLSRAGLEAELAQPIATVQTGDKPDPDLELPERTYLTDGIRRELSRTLGADAFLTGGLSVQASFEPRLQAIAERALRRGLESHDRGQRVFRPTGLTIDEALLEDEDAWRAALARTNIARDIDLGAQWRPAVVLSLSTRNARIGIEGVAEDADGHWLSYGNTRWRWRQTPEGRKGPWASRMSHLVKKGEVVHVRAILDRNGNFVRWSLRQIPELQGGFTAMEVDTGRVIAMQGGFSYQHSPFNRATQALRQPGSTFKPIVYAAALNDGFRPTSQVLDAPITIQTETGPWRPENSDHRSLGYAPMRVGLERSRNLMTVRLARDIGLAPIGALAENLNLYDEMLPNMANVLGAQETTLTQMVAAYASFANGGFQVQPTLVEQVFDRHGQPLEGIGSLQASARNNLRVLEPDIAYDLTQMLRGVIRRGTARNQVSLNVPVAGKTGTTDDAKDVWFIGYTTTVAAGCYIGYDLPRPIGPGATGASVCAPVFEEFMREAVKEFGGSTFAIVQ